MSDDPVIAAVANNSLARVLQWADAMATQMTPAENISEGDRTDLYLGLKDILEKLIIIRCELTAITGQIIRWDKSASDELVRRIGEEAEYLNQAYEQRFPSLVTSENGITWRNPPEDGTT